MPTLKKQVFDICQALAQHGWADLLREVTSANGQSNGLNIVQATEDDLESELLRERTIDRFFPGFEDFAVEGNKGITPSKPAHSILYHALASPKVIWQDKQKTQKLTLFPSLVELEIVENYVYGIRPPSISFLRNLFPGREMALVVFANQYRTAVDTPHVKHADLVFSRTGISRVGTAHEEYDSQTRSFNALDNNHPNLIRVLPAKYNLYLSVKLNGSKELLGKRFNTNFQTFSNIPKDEDLSFWYPIHKIFQGEECFQNVNKPVSFKYITKHTNEKIKRIHKFLIEEFDIDPGSSIQQFNDSPFKLSDIADIALIDDAALLLPKVKNALVAKAKDSNQVLSTLIKSFPLPTLTPRENSLNSFSSSLELRAVNPLNVTSTSSSGGPRKASEYMHIRTEITRNGENNLNDRSDLIDFIDSNQTFKALHYTDSTGDGFVTVAEVMGVPFVNKIVPSYSIVTAPDFFPLVEQSEVLNETLADLRIWFRRPYTIADTRLLPNFSSHPELTPGRNEVWDTVTALIPVTLDRNVQQTAFTDRTESRISYLTDGAAGIFAPGWDTSFDMTTISGVNVPHLASYGLGSPFPEDAKLCAALSSFWPAVAPDISRSFWPEENFSPTVVPLLDSEIGAHNESTSWDGERGPVVVIRDNRKFLRYKRFEYVDYTLNALNNMFDFHILAKVDAIEYVSRLRKMKSVKSLRNGDLNQWLFSSYTQVNHNDNDVVRVMQEQNITLQPVIHKFIFLRPRTGEPISVDNQFQMVDVEIDREAIVFVDATEKIVVLE